VSDDIVGLPPVTRPVDALLGGSRRRLPSTVASLEPLMHVRELTRSFGGVRAVAGATFEVQPHRITGLIGPNGAGKSTVINLIAGSIRPESGTVHFAGVDITGEPAHRVARRGIVRTFQRANLFPHLTVMENLLAAVPRMRGDTLAVALAGKRAWRSSEQQHVERLRGLLDRFGVGRYEDRYAGELSGGEKRLVELVRSLVAEPKLLLLDEPMAGVNPSRARDIAQHLRALADEGLTMLLIEHEMSFVESVCDHVIVMAQGQVLAEGKMADLRMDREVVNAYLS
jgi:ABC-type branched-subunit amino acid transport system ATPase component